MLHYEASVEGTQQIPRPSLLDCLATATAAMFSSEMEYDHTLRKFKWKQIQRFTVKKKNLRNHFDSGVFKLASAP